MKLFKILTFRKLFTNICVLIALIACGSNGLKLRDSGKAIQTGVLANANINQIFLEKKLNAEKKKKKSKSKAKTVSHSGAKKATENTIKSETEGKNTREESEEKATWGSNVNNIPYLDNQKAPFKNDTLSKAILRTESYRKWDFKMLDKQLSEIVNLMNFKSKSKNSQEGFRTFIGFFITNFEQCDKDADNQLSLKEFTKCMKNDTFLQLIDVPSKVHSPINSGSLNYPNETIYAEVLFNLLDENETGFLNFYSYMHLRLFIFSWKKCSTAAPAIEETNFECAIEIAAGWKTMNRNTVRRLYFFALDLSGNTNLRNLDFVTYVNFAQAVRLFGKINGKQNNDITRNELNLALDNNLLPLRYNQKSIDIFFKLVEEKDLPYQGLDILTFCYYDFFLKIFYKETIRGTYKLDKPQFEAALQSQLMPKYIYDEFLKIPQNNLTESSYRMYTYHNVTAFSDESEVFVRSFIEKESKFLTENENKNKWSNVDLYKKMTQFVINSKNVNRNS